MSITLSQRHKVSRRKIIRVITHERSMLMVSFAGRGHTHNIKSNKTVLKVDCCPFGESTQFTYSDIVSFVTRLSREETPFA